MAYIERGVSDGAFRQLSPEFVAHAFVGMVAHDGLEKVIFRRGLPQMERNCETSHPTLDRSGVHCVPHRKLGIPAKLNAYSGRNPNGIPG